MLSPVSVIDPSAAPLQDAPIELDEVMAETLRLTVTIAAVSYTHLRAHETG